MITSKDKVKAGVIARKAVKDGLLLKGVCEVCGSPYVHGHHDDYTNPIAIRWLCSKHHGKQHRRMGCELEVECPKCGSCNCYARINGTSRCQRCGYEGPKAEFEKAE